MPTADGDTDLYLVRARGGAPRNLTNELVDGVQGNNTQPSVAPDGRSVYHGRGTPVPGTGADLYRRRLDGSGAQQLTGEPFNDQGVDVSPDGRRLVFHSNRGGNDFDIYTMRADVEGPTNPAVNLTDALRSPIGAAAQERRP